MRKQFYLLAVFMLAFCMLFASACGDDDDGFSSSSESSASNDPPQDFEGNISSARAAITSITATAISPNITITGVVHAIEQTGRFWIQDRNAGIFVRLGSGGDSPAIGSKVTLTATQGQLFNQQVQITQYTGFSVVETGIAVSYKRGMPTEDHQGQAWELEDYNVGTSWVHNSNRELSVGIFVRNVTGSAIPPGTYTIRGPVGQFHEDLQVLVYTGGFTLTSSSFSPDPPPTPLTPAIVWDASLTVRPAGSWAADAALPAGSRPFNNYYANAYGKTGVELKTALQTIITTGHVNRGYGALWTMYHSGFNRSGGTDVVPTGPNAGKVWDMYSGYGTSPTGGHAAYWYTFGSCTEHASHNATFDTTTCNGHQAGGATINNEPGHYNREHVWCLSTIGGQTGSIQGSDGHHITPVNMWINGVRGDLPYGEVGTANRTFLNNNQTQNEGQRGGVFGPARASLGHTGNVYEPIDNYKGDHARMFFYMSVRYYGNTAFTDCPWAAPQAKLKPWFDTMIRQWHVNDPVSLKELNRNNAVHRYQGNRNPFIDYPELVTLIDFQN
jgi:endonuclease I